MYMTGLERMTTGSVAKGLTQSRHTGRQAVWQRHSRHSWTAYDINDVAWFKLSKALGRSI